MTVADVHRDLDSVLQSIGRAGRRLVDLNACEGGAGNISLVQRADLDAGTRFPERTAVELPVPVPALAGSTIVATGSGCRLRDVLEDPEGNLGCLVVDPGGTTATLLTSPHRRFARLTSELNSHLAVHARQIEATGCVTHALVHAHPPHLTFLSHVPAYADQATLNRQLMRWEPETIIFLPEGIGVAPFRVPGSDDLMAATQSLLARHQIVVWGKHGAIARSFTSPEDAVDRIEYAEVAARYEVMNLGVGERASGMSVEEIRAVCAFHRVDQSLF